tara:strand:+ start:239 stop:469 length:231 start_codon:yes stop_codon:yes gene_type:complete
MKSMNGYEKIRFMIQIIDEMQELMDGTGKLIDEYYKDGKKRKFKNKEDESRYEDLVRTHYSSMSIKNHYENTLKKL